MAVQAQYLAYVLEQLAGLGALRPNRMFGGIGLYSDGLFFGLIDDDTLFFKTSDANIAAYRARSMPKFMPFPDKTGAVMGYHQVPADVIEDAETLVQWARQSVAVALTAQANKAAKKKNVRKPRTPSVKSRRKAPPPPARDRKSASARKSAAKKSPARKSPARKK
jgi:DNA transformation protein